MEQEAVSQKLAVLQTYRTMLEQVLELIAQNKIPEEIAKHQSLLTKILSSMTNNASRSTASLSFLIRAEESLKKFKERVKPFIEPKAITYGCNPLGVKVTRTPASKPLIKQEPSEKKTASLNKPATSTQQPSAGNKLPDVIPRVHSLSPCPPCKASGTRGASVVNTSAPVVPNNSAIKQQPPYQGNTHNAATGSSNKPTTGAQGRSVNKPASAVKEIPVVKQEPLSQDKINNSTTGAANKSTAGTPRTSGNKPAPAVKDIPIVKQEPLSQGNTHNSTTGAANKSTTGAPGTSGNKPTPAVKDIPIVKQEPLSQDKTNNATTGAVNKPTTVAQGKLVNKPAPAVKDIPNVKQEPLSQAKANNGTSGAGNKPTAAPGTSVVNSPTLAFKNRPPTSTQAPSRAHKPPGVTSRSSAVHSLPPCAPVKSTPVIPIKSPSIANKAPSRISAVHTLPPFAQDKVSTTRGTSLVDLTSPAVANKLPTSAQEPSLANKPPSITPTSSAVHALPPCAPVKPSVVRGVSVVDLPSTEVKNIPITKQGPSSENKTGSCGANKPTIDTSETAVVNTPATLIQAPSPVTNVPPRISAVHTLPLCEPDKLSASRGTSVANSTSLAVAKKQPTSTQTPSLANKPPGITPTSSAVHALPPCAPVKPSVVRGASLVNLPSTDVKNFTVTKQGPSSEDKTGSCVANKPTKCTLGTSVVNAPATSIKAPSTANEALERSSAVHTLPPEELIAARGASVVNSTSPAVSRKTPVATQSVSTANKTPDSTARSSAVHSATEGASAVNLTSPAVARKTPVATQSVSTANKTPDSTPRSSAVYSATASAVNSPLSAVASKSKIATNDSSTEKIPPIAIQEPSTAYKTPDIPPRVHSLLPCAPDKPSGIQGASVVNSSSVAANNKLPPSITLPSTANKTPYFTPRSAAVHALPPCAPYRPPTARPRGVATWSNAPNKTFRSPAVHSLPPSGPFKPLYFTPQPSEANKTCTSPSSPPAGHTLPPSAPSKPPSATTGTFEVSKATVTAEATSICISHAATVEPESSTRPTRQPRRRNRDPDVDSLVGVQSSKPYTVIDLTDVIQDIPDVNTKSVASPTNVTALKNLPVSIKIKARPSPQLNTLAAQNFRSDDTSETASVVVSSETLGVAKETTSEPIVLVTEKVTKSIPDAKNQTVSEPSVPFGISVSNHENSAVRSDDTRSAAATLNSQLLVPIEQNKSAALSVVQQNTQPTNKSTLQETVLKSELVSLSGSSKVANAQNLAPVQQLKTPKNVFVKQVPTVSSSKQEVKVNAKPLQQRQSDQVIVNPVPGQSPSIKVNLKPIIELSPSKTPQVQTTHTNAKPDLVLDELKSAKEPRRPAYVNVKQQPIWSADKNTVPVLSPFKSAKEPTSSVNVETVPAANLNRPKNLVQLAKPDIPPAHTALFGNRAVNTRNIVSIPLTTVPPIAAASNFTPQPLRDPITSSDFFQIQPDSLTSIKPSTVTVKDVQTGLISSPLQLSKASPVAAEAKEGATDSQAVDSKFEELSENKIIMDNIKQFLGRISTIDRLIKTASPSTSGTASPISDGDLMDMAITSDPAALLYKSRKKLLEKVSFDHIAPEAPNIGSISDTRTSITQGRRYRSNDYDDSRSPPVSCRKSYSGSPRWKRSPSPSINQSRYRDPSPNRYNTRSPKYDKRLSRMGQKPSRSPVYSRNRSISPRRVRKRSNTPVGYRHSRSPRRQRSRSPKPSCYRSRSPRKSPSRGRRRTRSPVVSRRRSKSPILSRRRSKSPSPSKRRSKSPYEYRQLSPKRMMKSNEMKSKSLKSDYSRSVGTKSPKHEPIARKSRSKEPSRPKRDNSKSPSPVSHKRTVSVRAKEKKHGIWQRLTESSEGSSSPKAVSDLPDAELIDLLQHSHFPHLKAMSIPEVREWAKCVNLGGNTDTFSSDRTIEIFEGGASDVPPPPSIRNEDETFVDDIVRRAINPAVKTPPSDNSDWEEPNLTRPLEKYTIDNPGRESESVEQLRETVSLPSNTKSVSHSQPTDPEDFIIAPLQESTVREVTISSKPSDSNAELTNKSNEASEVTITPPHQSDSEEFSIASLKNVVTKESDLPKSVLESPTTGSHKNALIDKPKSKASAERSDSSNKDKSIAKDETKGIAHTQKEHTHEVKHKSGSSKRDLRVNRDDRKSTSKSDIASSSNHPSLTTKKELSKPPVDNASVTSNSSKSKKEKGSKDTYIAAKLGKSKTDITLPEQIDKLLVSSRSKSLESKKGANGFEANVRDKHDKGLLKKGGHAPSHTSKSKDTGVKSEDVKKSKSLSLADYHKRVEKMPVSKVIVGKPPSKMSFQDLLNAGDAPVPKKKPVSNARERSRSTETKTKPSFSSTLTSAESPLMKNKPILMKRPITSDKECNAASEKKNVLQSTPRPIADFEKGAKLVAADTKPNPLDMDDENSSSSQNSITDLILNMEESTDSILLKKSLLDLPMPCIDNMFLMPETPLDGGAARGAKSSNCAIEPKFNKPAARGLLPSPSLTPALLPTPSLTPALLPTPNLTPGAGLYMTTSINPIAPLMAIQVVGVDPSIAHRRPVSTATANDAPLAHRRANPADELLFHRRDCTSRAVSTYFTQGPQTYAEHKELKLRQEKLRMEELERQRRKEIEESQKRIEALKKLKDLDPRLRRKTVDFEDLPDSEMKEPEDFQSPLISLYGVVDTAQTGRGYGKQKFRIPKKACDAVSDASSSPVVEVASQSVKDVVIPCPEVFTEPPVTPYAVSDQRPVSELKTRVSSPKQSTKVTANAPMKPINTEMEISERTDVEKIEQPPLIASPVRRSGRLGKSPISETEYETDIFGFRKRQKLKKTESNVAIELPGKRAVKKNCLLTSEDEPDSFDQDPIVDEMSEKQAYESSESAQCSPKKGRRKGKKVLPQADENKDYNKIKNKSSNNELSSKECDVVEVEGAFAVEDREERVLSEETENDNAETLPCKRNRKVSNIARGAAKKQADKKKTKGRKKATKPKPPPVPQPPNVEELESKIMTKLVGRVLGLLGATGMDVSSFAALLSGSENAPEASTSGLIDKSKEGIIAKVVKETGKVPIDSKTSASISIDKDAVGDFTQMDTNFERLEDPFESQPEKNESDVAAPADVIVTEKSTVADPLPEKNEPDVAAPADVIVTEKSTVADPQPEKNEPDVRAPANVIVTKKSTVADPQPEKNEPDVTAPANVIVTEKSTEVVCTVQVPVLEKDTNPDFGNQVHSDAVNVSKECPEIVTEEKEKSENEAVFADKVEKQTPVIVETDNFTSEKPAAEVSKPLPEEWRERDGVYCDSSSEGRKETETRDSIKLDAVVTGTNLEPNSKADNEIDTEVMPEEKSVLSKTHESLEYTKDGVSVDIDEMQNKQTRTDKNVEVSVAIDNKEAKEPLSDEKKKTEVDTVVQVEDTNSKEMLKISDEEIIGGAMKSDDKHRSEVAEQEKGLEIDKAQFVEKAADKQIQIDSTLSEEGTKNDSLSIDLNIPVSEPSSSALSQTSKTKFFESLVSSEEGADLLAEIIRTHADKFRHLFGAPVEKPADTVGTRNERDENKAPAVKEVVDAAVIDAAEPVCHVSDDAVGSSEDVSPSPPKGGAVEEKEDEETQSQEISSSLTTKTTKMKTLKKSKMRKRKSNRLKSLSKKLTLQMPCEDNKTRAQHMNEDAELARELEQETENFVRVTRSTHRIKDTPTPNDADNDDKHRLLSSEPEKKAAAKKSQPKKSELDRLHEHLSHSFISANLMNTSMQRSCRSDVREAREPEAGKRGGKKTSQEEPSGMDSYLRGKKSVRRDGSSDTVQSRDSSVRSRRRLRDSSSDSNTSEESGEMSEIQSSRESTPERVRLRACSTPINDPKLNVLPQVLIHRETRHELVRQQRRNTARRGRQWGSAAGLRRQCSQPAVESEEPERKLRPRLRNVAVDELASCGNNFTRDELLNHAYAQNDAVVKCLRCSTSENLSKMAEHYRTKHPESEVLISRLPVSEAARAIEDSEKNEYTLSDIRDTLDPSKYSAPKKSSTMTCRLCRKVISAAIDEQLFLHATAHTGEYRWKCGAAKCPVTSLTVESIRSHVTWRHNEQRKQLQNAAVELFPIPKTYGNIFGYICTKCNFVQTLLTSVEAHVAREHVGKAKIVKIDLFTEASAEENAKSPVRSSSRLAIAASESSFGAGANFGPVAKENDVATDASAEKIASATVEEQIEPREDQKRAVARKTTGPKSKKTKPDPPPEETVANASSEDEMIRPRPRTTVAKKSTAGRRKGMMGVKKDGKVLEERMRSIIEMSKSMKVKKRKDMAQEKLLSVGPLEVKWNTNGSLLFRCHVGNCKVITSAMQLFERHVNMQHRLAHWSGKCDTCHSYPFGMPTSSLKLSTALEHVASHLDPEWGKKPQVPEPTPLVMDPSEEQGTAIARNIDTWSHQQPEVLGDVTWRQGLLAGPPMANNLEPAWHMPLDDTQPSQPELENVFRPAKLERRSTTPELVLKQELKFHVSQTTCLPDDVHLENLEAPILKPEILSQPSLNDLLDRPILEPETPPQKKPLIRVKAPADLFPPQEAPSVECDDIPLTQSHPIVDIRGEVDMPLSGEVQPGTETEVELRPEEPSLSAADDTGLASPSRNTTTDIVTSVPSRDVQEEGTAVDSNGGPSTLNILQRSERPGVVTTHRRELTPFEIDELKEVVDSNRGTSTSYVLQKPERPRIIVLPKRKEVAIVRSDEEEDTPAIEINARPSTSNVLQRAERPGILRHPNREEVTIVRNDEPQEATSIVEIKTRPSSSYALQGTDWPGSMRTADHQRLSYEEAARKKSIQIMVDAVRKMTAEATSSEHDLVHMGLVVKVRRVLSEMLREVKLVELFKCTSLYCSFTGVSAEVFRKHCLLHQDAEKKKKETANWRICAYCSETLGDPTSLSRHIEAVHGSSEHQCGYCFYRAILRVYVSLHIESVHEKSPKKILKCARACLEGPIYVSTQEAKYNSMSPYTCVLCQHSVVGTNEFMMHLRTKHATSTKFSCHVCTSVFLRPQPLLVHYMIRHGYDNYHCGYCPKSANSIEAMLSHFSGDHPAKKPSIFARSHPEKEDTSWLKFNIPEKSTTTKGRKRTVMEALAAMEGSSDTSQSTLLPNTEFSSSVDDDQPGVADEPVFQVANSELSSSTVDDQPTRGINQPPSKMIKVVKFGKHAVDDNRAICTIVKPAEMRPPILSKSVKLSPLKMPKAQSAASSVTAPPVTATPVTPESDSDIEVIAEMVANRSSENDLSEIVELRKRMHSVRDEEFSGESGRGGMVGRLVDKLIVETLERSEKEGSPEVAVPGCAGDMLVDEAFNRHNVADSPEKTPPGDEPKVLSPILDAIASLNKSLQAEKSAAHPEHIVLQSDDDNNDDNDYDDDDNQRLIICDDSDNTPAVTLAPPPPKKKRKMLVKRSLSGTQLFLCGNSSCAYAAENSTDLTEHLMSCSLDECLSCRLCTFQSHSTCSYLKHLMSKHGPMRFKCGICGVCSTQHGTNLHMQYKHKVVPGTFVPVDPMRNNKETDHFIVHPSANVAQPKKTQKAKPKTDSGSKSPVPESRSTTSSPTPSCTVATPSPESTRTTSPSPAPSPVHQTAQTPVHVPRTPSRTIQSPPAIQRVRGRDDAIYGPDDEDMLPMSAVYSYDVKCAVCSYTNKVRSNMVRHLRLHKEAEGRGVVVPSSAPTNPVPCQGGPRMFDKMTNLAASSLLERIPVNKLTDAETLRLPGYVPENYRYPCCALECTSYFSVDIDMLRHHMSALHSEMKEYKCPNCLESVPASTRVVPIAAMADHFKLHDTKLYKCAHCDMMHFIRSKVERHVTDTHPDRRQYVHTIREPKAEPEVMRAFKCCLCASYLCLTVRDMTKHLLKRHRVKGKFKCRECDYVSQNTAFGTHFARCHGNRPVKYDRCYTKVTASSDKIDSHVESPEAADPTAPLWRRGAAGPRTIRGIPIDSGESTVSTTTCAELPRKRSHSRDNHENYYSCKICNTFTTQSMSELRSHFRMELSYALYTCVICEVPFYDMILAKEHASSKHPTVKDCLRRENAEPEIDYWMEVACDKQKKEQDTKKKAKKHETSKPAETVTKPTPSSRRISAAPTCPPGHLMCPHCDVTHEFLTGMKTHIINVHLQLGRFICNDCRQTFHSEAQARTHAQEVHERVQVHQNPNFEWYQVTDIFWKVHYGLKEPCQTTFQVTDYESLAVRCEVESCDITTLPQLMVFHQRQAHSPVHTCSIVTHSSQTRMAMCNFTAQTVTELSSHMDEKHSYREKLFRGITSYDLDFPCNQYACLFKTSIEIKLIEHLRTQHGLHIKPVWEIKKKFYNCGYCRMRCAGPVWVTKHLQTTHTGLALACRISGVATLQPIISSLLSALVAQPVNEPVAPVCLEEEDEVVLVV